MADVQSYDAPNLGVEVQNDEPFIDRILEHPDDESVREEYAKSRESQGDLRGAEFIRKEMECVRSGGKEAEEKLRQLTVGLDPRWVATISAPPIGACADWGRDCKPILFAEQRAEIAARLDDIQSNHVGKELDAVYRAFMTNYRGGQPWPRDFRAADYYAEGSSEELRWLLEPTGDPESDSTWSLEAHIEMLNNVRLMLGIWDCEPHNCMMPIGFHGEMRFGKPGVLFLAIGGQFDGHIFMTRCGGTSYDMRDVGLDHVAPSFGNLLAKLTDHSPDHVKAVRGGDVAPLRQWLEDGGNANASYRCINLLDHAIKHSNPEAVRELLANGAQGKHRLLFAESYGCEEVIALLREAKR